MKAHRRPLARARLVHAARIVGLAVAYVAAGRLGLLLAPGHGFATLVWLPSGLSLAALLIGGCRLCPGVAAGAFVTSLWAGAPPLVACGVSAGSTLEAALATLALRRVPGFQSALHRFTDVVALVVLGGLLSSAVGASAGIASVALGGVLPAGGASRAWLTWWAADLLGVLVVAPAWLTWTGGPCTDPRPSARAEAAALGALLVACAWLVFGAPLGAALERQVLRPALLFLPLVWAALRFGTRGAASAVLATAAAGLAGTAAGRGAFAGAAGGPLGLVGLQVFLGTAAIASLAVGAVVCERERSRRDLRENEALLRAIVDGATDAIFVKDAGGRYVVMNPAGARLFGMPVEALVGKDDDALFPAEEARLLHEGDAEVMRCDAPRAIEEPLTIAGEPRVYLTTKTPYHDRAGGVLGVIGIARDITERKNAELSRARLAAIVESSADAMIGQALDGTITSWNAAAQRLYGYAPEEAIGRSITMLVPPERQGELGSLLERMRRGERIEGYEIVRRRKDGTMVDIALTASPIRDAAGVVTGFATIPRDVTEVAERQRLAVEAAHLGLWFWNIKSGRLVWTPLCKQMYGIGPDEEVSYARLLAALHPEDRARTERAVAAAIEGHGDYRVEHRVLWPDGTVRWLSVLGRALYDDAGAADRMLGVTRDVTAQKEAEAERAELFAREQAARAEAQAATRARDEFLAVVSHELRTPLQAMLGWTHLLLARRDEDPAVQKGLRTIERSVRAQGQLIEDLLDVSRIVSGKLRIERRRVALAEVVEAAVESARPSADARSIRLSAALGPVEGDVLGDPGRLQQVVANLLANALKFTPSGGHVTVRLGREGESALLTVEDDGCGIPAAFLPYVFDRFRQAESTTSRPHGGLGLGLSIVHRLVELHGGAVKAESPGIGRGATFTVTLPLVSARRAAVDEEPALAARDRPPERVELDGVRVLVVDDDPDVRELVGTVLHTSGADVHAVASARAALVELAAFHPHLLLSDVGMPGEDGYALMRAVRARESSEGSHVPAIALSAFASPADREQALTVGFDEHLAKPASPADLTKMVARLTQRAA